MMKLNYSKIVSVSARTAIEKRFRSKSGAYAVSKAGIIVLTETIAEEVKKYDINVNCIIPSTIDTPDNRRNFPSGDLKVGQPGGNCQSDPLPCVRRFENNQRCITPGLRKSIAR